MYFVTYQPSSQDGQVVHAINTANTTNSTVVIRDLDLTTEYIISVDVRTGGGEHRSTLGAGTLDGITTCVIAYKQAHSVWIDILRVTSTHGSAW